MLRLLVSLLMMFMAWPILAADVPKTDPAKPAKTEAPKDEFPYRVRYPDVSIISTQQLAAKLKDMVVIDVRSKYEYDTLHIKDAVHVELKSGFGEKISALRDKHKKAFVFYCNGKTCQKSYDAVLLAGKARVDNLYAYDAGIFDWAKAQPDHTVLLGRSPIRPTDLISEAQFKARLIESKDFSSRVGDKSIVLDLRDRAQRDSALFPFQEQRAELSDFRKIDAVIADARAQKKTLLVYDEAGKQVQWVQYYLENKGVKDYYFMKGGAKAHFEATLGKVVLGGEDKGKKAAGSGSAKP